MRLKDIISTGLLPRFAADAAWMQAALDAWIRSSVGRFAALGAPFTLESVQALTDDELQELYNQYNIVEYYPDLSRTTRELMIYNISRLRRRLGTKAAVVALVQYVFDGLELSVDIYDNLAFDEAGELVDESLIDVYDVEITLSDVVLTDEIRNRLLKNIFRLVPDRLGLRNIIFSYPINHVQNRQVIIPGSEIVVENDAVCEPITPPVQTLTAYFTSAGASGTGNTVARNSNTYRLYDASGNLIPMDNTKAYVFAGSYVYNGDSTYDQFWYFPYDINSSYLNIKTNGNKDVFRIEYIERPLVNAYFASDKSSVSFGAKETKVLYDDDGNQIEFDIHSVYIIYSWRTSTELTTRYTTFYKLRCNSSYLVCTNTNNTAYSGDCGLQFYTLQAKIGYLSADKTPVSGFATSMQLYDENGNAIIFESGKTYKIHDVFDGYGNSIEPGYLGYWSLIDSSGMLYWKSDQDISLELFIQYTVS